MTLAGFIGIAGASAAGALMKSNVNKSVKYIGTIIIALITACIITAVS